MGLGDSFSKAIGEGANSSAARTPATAVNMKQNS
jgi:hypothetical protein